jgi:ribosomal protein L14E/L6E/L27E
MKLSDKWFMALSENDNGNIIYILGREELNEFMESKKLKERVEITWKYEADDKGMPSDDVAEKMEAMETALKKAVEKDKLAIMTAVYTGDGEKVWVFYTRTARVFGERLNDALSSFETLPISLYVEADSDWEEYKDMYEMKQWAVD